jgi:hypothetical protein
MCAAAARVSDLGSPSTRGRGPRPLLGSSSLPTSGPVIARAFVQRAGVIRLEGPAGYQYWQTVNSRWWGRSVRYDVYLVSGNPFAYRLVYRC